MEKSYNTKMVMHTTRPKETFSVERLKTRTKADKRKHRFLINKLSIEKPEKTGLKADNNNPNYFNTISNEKETGHYPNLKKMKMFRSESLSRKKDFLRDRMPYIPERELKKSEENFICLVKELIRSKQQNNVISMLNKQQNAKNSFNEFCENSRRDPYKPIGYNYYEFSRIHPDLSNDEDNNYVTILQKLKSKVDNEKEDYNKTNNTLNNFSNRNLKNSFNRLIKLSKGSNLFKDNTKDENKPNNDNTFNAIAQLNHSSEPVNNRYNNKTINIFSDRNQQVNLPKIIIDKNIQKTIFDSNNMKNDYSKSDIFNLSNDNDWQKKTGEKYLYKNNYFNFNKNAHKTNINKIGWNPKDNNKNRSRIGCPSVGFNILNPSLRSISPTKMELDKLNNNQYYKTPIISEYVNISKPGENEIRKEYIEQLQQNKNIFHKKDFCACYGDLRNEYKNLVEDIF